MTNMAIKLLNIGKEANSSCRLPSPKSWLAINTLITIPI